MAACSPRVGITLMGTRQARFRRRLSTHHPQAHNAPPEAIPSVAGSGTGLARRKPTSLNSPDGTSVNLKEDDKLNAALTQLPPRRPRDEPAAPVRSFHSHTLPLWSNVP